MPIGIYVRTRLRQEEGGFGLIELLMAITMLNIGILAIVAAFNTGIVTLHRSSLTATASVLADQQMELYRAVTWDQISLDSSALATVDNTYKCDSALGAGCPNSTTPEVTTTCTSPIPNECNPSQSVSGADHKPYRVDTYITTTTPSGGRSVKVVSVVVRDGNHISARPLARVSSTFDQSTG